MQTGSCKKPVFVFVTQPSWLIELIMMSTLLLLVLRVIAFCLACFANSSKSFQVDTVAVSTLAAGELA